MNILRKLRLALRDEGGFSITELLVSIAAGTAVLLGILATLDTSLTASADVSDRVEAGQRGRLAMELVTTPLRSRVCLEADVADTSIDDSRTGVTQADGSSISFYTDLGSDEFTPERHQLVFANGAITESVYAASGTAPNFTFSATPSDTRTLITGVAAPSGGSVFRYYAYQPTGTPTADLELTATPLSVTDLRRIVKVDVSFRVSPEHSQADQRLSSLFQDSVFARGSRFPDATTNPPDLGGIECLYN